MAARRPSCRCPRSCAMLADGMGREASVSVLQALHSVTAQIMTLPADPAWVPRRQGASLPRPGPGCCAAPSRAATTSWPGRSCSAGPRPRRTSSTCSPGCWTAPPRCPGLAVDAELRWAILRRLAVTGRAGDAEIDAELTRDHDRRRDRGTPPPAARRYRTPRTRPPPGSLLAETGGLGAMERGRVSAAASSRPSTPTCSPRTPSVTSTRCRRSGRRRGGHTSRGARPAAVPVPGGLAGPARRGSTRSSPPRRDPGLPGC